MTDLAPDFFYFDLGNVLVHFDHEWACRNLAQITGCDPDQARAALFQSGLERRYERGELSTAAFCSELRERLGVFAADDQLAWATSAIFELNVQMTPLVAHLAASGRRMGILSNTCETHWNYCVQRYRVLTSCFERHALSYQLRCLKPELEIYQLAAELVGVPGDRVFLVDDIPDNVAGARAAGWDAIHFESVRAVADQLRRRGVDFNL